jgi:hypothetical protein
MSGTFNLHCRHGNATFSVTDWLPKGDDRLTVNIEVRHGDDTRLAAEATLYVNKSQLRELRNVCSEALRARDPLSPEDQELREAGEAFFADKTAETCCRLVNAARASYAARPRDNQDSGLFPHQNAAVSYAQSEGRIRRPGVPEGCGPKEADWWAKYGDMDHPPSDLLEQARNEDMQTGVAADGTITDKPPMRHEAEYDEGTSDDAPMGAVS